DEYVISGVGANEERKEDRFTAAGRRQNLIEGQLDAEPPLVVVLQRLQILRRSLRRGVFEHMRVHVFEAIAHARRRLDVRLADVEVIHLDPTPLRSVGERDQLSNRRGRKIERALGKREGLSKICRGHGLMDSPQRAQSSQRCLSALSGYKL